MHASLVETPLTARQRYEGLLYGAFVADSLTLGAHWIYDQDEISQQFGRITDLLAPEPDGYHPGKSRGDLTHYGDQTLVLLESLNACAGNFVMEDFARRWRQFWAESKSYRDHATKATLANLEAGLRLTKAASDSDELGGAARLAPLLVALRNEDQPTIIAAARAQTAFTHASPAVIDAAEFITRMVFLLMRGVTVSNAMRMTALLPTKVLPVQDYLRKAESVAHLPTGQAVEELGMSCPLPKAFPAVFLLLLQHGDNLETALIENVMAGGDSAARALVLGTLLGAAYGRRAIPDRWIEPLQAHPRLETFLQTVGVASSES